MLLILTFFYILSQGIAAQEFFLSQSDFDFGSFIISEPGTYVLTEDVVFSPNLPQTPIDAFSLEKPELFMFPTNEQRAGKYSDRAYNLGFFAAIVVATHDVVIDLNGFTLSQSEVHSTMQRFFALIELTNSPFPPNTGPANFSTTEEFVTGENVVVRNGRLGNSAHHGIHCNGCKNVLIEDLVIEEFEVAGILLNSASDATFRRVVIQKSKRNVKWSGRLSQAIFSLQALSVHIAPLLDLSSLSFAFKGSERIVENIISAQENVRKELRKVIHFELSTSQTERDFKRLSPFFVTVTKGLPDGSLLAGIMIHPTVNVDGFKENIDQDSASKNYLFEDIEIRDLSAHGTEQTTLISKRNNKPVTDMIGAVFDVDAAREMSSGSFNFVPNLLANLQLAITKLRIFLEATGLDFGGELSRLFSRDGIPSEIVSWCDGNLNWFDLIINGGFSLTNNRDFMFHLNKGVVGLKIDQTTNVEIKNVLIQNLENFATLKDRSFFYQNLEASKNVEGVRVDFSKKPHEMFAVRGLSLAADSSVSAENLRVHDLTSNFEDKVVSVDFLNQNFDIDVSVTSSGITEGNCDCELDFELEGLLPSFPHPVGNIKQDEFSAFSVPSDEFGNPDEGLNVDLSDGIYLLLFFAFLTSIFVFFFKKQIFKRKASSEKKTVLNHYVTNGSTDTKVDVIVE